MKKKKLTKKLIDDLLEHGKLIREYKKNIDEVLNSSEYIKQGLTKGFYYSKENRKLNNLPMKGRIKISRKDAIMFLLDFLFLARYEGDLHHKFYKYLTKNNDIAERLLLTIYNIRLSDFYDKTEKELYYLNQLRIRGVQNSKDRLRIEEIKEELEREKEKTDFWNSKATKNKKWTYLKDDIDKLRPMRLDTAIKSVIDKKCSNDLTIKKALNKNGNNENKLINAIKRSLYR